MKALVIGVLGQDGSYLAEQLTAAGYEVWGMTRRAGAIAKVPLVAGDLLDRASIERALIQVQPDEVYNVAAVTSPGGSWGAAPPPLLMEATGLGVVTLLDSMVKFAPDARLVHASSSAIYDPARYGLYGAAKRLAHDAVVGYRSQLHCSNAILFSHTSPRQDRRFLAPRICAAVAGAERMTLGDIDSRRDWGYAPDYCTAMRRIARHGSPGDWVVCTGQTRTVRELAQAALDVAGKGWDEAFNLDPAATRVPHELPVPQGEKRVTELGWRPRTGVVEMWVEMLRGSRA